MEGDRLSGRTALGEEFFARSPQEVAHDLIGCALLHDGAGGVIVETEAYAEEDPACHAYVGLTPRTAALFGPPGRAYVYLSYGIHSLFNIVTEPDGVAAAVLVRALEPRWGLERMQARRGGRPERDLCSGPGKLASALGIDLSHYGDPIADGGPLRVLAREPDGEPEIVTGPRIGITKGVEIPWRFCLGGSRWLSAPAG